MALVMRHPNKHDWAFARPTVEKLRKEQQTADYIARQLGIRYGFRVTKKMVYDRLREWHAPPKYQRHKSQQRLTRAVSIPREDVQMHAALSSIGVFLDDLTKKAAWQLPAVHLDLDFQRLVADALMAISSTSYDTRAVWEELRGMDDRVEAAISTFSVAMHPRVFSVLLRLLVQNQQTNPIERGAIRLVKGMICRKSSACLQPSHPVSLLCALELAPKKTEDFLEKFTTQLKNRLHDKISESSPDFVALEKIYTARALASFGFPGTADTVLESAASLRIRDVFTRAEYHRTVGFSQFQKNTPTLTEAALSNLELALQGYQSIGKGSNIEAMYVNYNLGSLLERKQDYDGCVHHLEAALEIWELNSSSHQQRGGIKYVRDLYEAYKRTDRTTEMTDLRDRYAEYFEESVYHGAG